MSPKKKLSSTSRNTPSTQDTSAESRVVGQAAMPLPERKKLAAADFYSALQRSLDGMQRRLSASNNAFADFVVKEFRIDAAVQIQVNDLGILQLIPADDNMSASSISRLSLSLAAVAKAQSDPLLHDAVAADATSLVDLTWLAPGLAAQLAEHEVRTVSEFLGLVSDARLCAQFTSLLKVRRADIGRWTSQMRLLQLPGMTIQNIVVLAKAKIFSPTDIAGLTNEAFGALQRKTTSTISPETLMRWRESTKQG